MEKPIIYSEIPNFNQETQYVTQQKPVEMDDYIFVGLEIRGLTISDEELEDLLIVEMGL